VGIDNREYPVSQLGVQRILGLELGPGDSHVEIDFRPIHFTASERLRFQYRLLGASGRWSAPSDLQSVHFANLAPGSYVFEARSVAESGLASAAAVLSFHLQPPVWRRPWFLTLLALLTASGGFLLHRYRLSQALMVERVRTRLATDLHDDLGAGLAEIAILSEVGRRSSNTTDDTLDQVAKRARALRATLGDIVWTVDPRKDRLPSLVHRMRETALSMLETEDRRVRFRAPGEAELESKELSPDLRRHILLFFKEAVVNVARHSAAREVDLELTLDNESLGLRIRDDGRGFDPAVPTEGRGLSSLRYRAAEMRGQAWIEAAPGRGAEIRLRVPLRR
jgi:signal transduction histidine kinase